MRRIQRTISQRKSALVLRVGIAFLVFSGCAVAGPFGLEMGLTIDQIDSEATIAAPKLYTTTKVPKPHSAFEQYALKVGPASGLCWIKGIGKDVATSAYGLELKVAFNELKNKLEKAYGKSKVTDILLPGSIWDEQNDFMMALLKKERILMALWEDQSVLPSNLTGIGLIASPMSRDKGYVSVEYSFSNKDACDLEIANQEDDAL